jgi:hypothetical protein
MFDMELSSNRTNNSDTNVNCVGFLDCWNTGLRIEGLRDLTVYAVHPYISNQ